MKDYLICALMVLGFASIVLFALWYNTSADAWYAGKHDAKCNMAENCGCYERLRGDK